MTNDKKKKVADLITGLRKSDKVSKDKIYALSATIKELIAEEKRKEDSDGLVVSAVQKSQEEVQKTLGTVRDETRKSALLISQGLKEVREALPQEVREVSITNILDVPIAKEMEVTNLGEVEKDLTEIRKSSFRLEKQGEENRVLFFELLKELLKGIGTLLSKITFKVQPTALHYETPQHVIIYDPVTKKAMSIKDLAQKSNSGQAFSTVVVDTDSIVNASQEALHQYHVSDVDDAGTTKYYGFLRANGYWYILQENTTASPKTYRYAVGTLDYTTAWTGRAGLTYGYFDTAF